MRFSLVILLIIKSMSVCAFADSNQQQIEERIKPIGQVRLADQEILAANTKLAQSGTQTNPAQEIPGQAIYEQFCSACHRDGLAGAPKFRVAADWQSRLDKKSLDELVASAVKGVNAMPAKGTCTDCSATDLKNAIQYMLPQS